MAVAATAAGRAGSDDGATDEEGRKEYGEGEGEEYGEGQEEADEGDGKGDGDGEGEDEVWLPARWVPGLRCDAKDKKGNWAGGTIAKVDLVNGRVMVHFPGATAAPKQAPPSSAPRTGDASTVAAGGAPTLQCADRAPSCRRGPGLSTPPP